MSYKTTIPLADRLLQAENMIRAHPDHVPVIVERDPHCLDLPDITNKKFCVPKVLTVGNFIYCVRKRIQMQETDAIFLFIGKLLPSPNETMGSLYQMNRHDDGILYCTYSSDHAYGSDQ